jgi:NADH dehydrogenase
MHVLIIGGGFGGIYTLRRLRKYFTPEQMQITLVSKSDHFLFTPLLHEAATGNIAHQQITESLHSLSSRYQAELIVGEVEQIALDQQSVSVNGLVLNYDYLVMAMGASTNYFGIPGAAQYTLPLKNLVDSTALNLKLSELAATNIAIVGGGATGVELAMELVSITNGQDTQIHIIDRLDSLIPQSHPHVRTKASATLTQNNVNLLLGKTVAEVRQDGISFADGSSLPAELIIWTAGVRANTEKLIGQVELDRAGRVAVNADLRLDQYPNVFAIGDMAGFANTPMTAQAAVHQSVIAAKNIRNLIYGMQLEQFHFKSQGDLFSLGKWNAVGIVLNIPISGAPAWVLWRCVYLLKYITLGKKLEVIRSWFWHEVNSKPVLKDPL